MPFNSEDDITICLRIRLKLLETTAFTILTTCHPSSTCPANCATRFTTHSTTTITQSTSQVMAPYDSQHWLTSAAKCGEKHYQSSKT